MQVAHDSGGHFSFSHFFFFLPKIRGGGEGEGGGGARSATDRKGSSRYICFAISFGILTFPLGGFIRNMNILLGDILLIFFL